ncbi:MULTISPECIES: TetR/AcrR family transcriptional regulator [Tatumella]|uniref:TetR/AcrR family transcriptional regulator n=1 Tax=Tatumella punctata TaxID=399969 RepID=A0ABW1VMF0_9GAMM|nr:MULTISPECIES: TetR/AcrR family transcriptional regulator [unclassified Tatumella]MBS0855266.1 TetR/AcrR family transcriptional regulator [Tatumella sp. JGM16]MBS0876819.1 TetR/AcrR family transcriptional regulator [Tatumella sp. JGM82]MBS0889756.1 TetR/AcrR family transcriptional regulator [Tatumella sp. JGM94]MBS0892834.1 TetR/AcrR family transcriptional regulator [Tatumella sp. JGM130]MBS0902786.1 TetR/AcrR family transcriptional regulator [Tatumella sp. JGM100]
MTPDNISSASDKLLKAAQVLFYNYGITATGIDALVKRAGVAKKSLYNNFSSKDALIEAYITARHQQWLDLYQRRAAEIISPQEGVMAVFSAYADHAGFDYEHAFRGCGLLNAAAELPTGSAGRQAISRHKQQVEDILKQHLSQLTPDHQRSDLLARHLSFLLEGSISRAGLEGNSHYVQQAAEMARILTEAL